MINYGVVIALMLTATLLVLFVGWVVDDIRDRRTLRKRTDRNGDSFI